MSETTRSERKRWGPLKEGHPVVGETCPGCGRPLEVGDVPTIVTIGPGADEDARQRAREGRPYNAVAMPAHYECVYG